MLIKITTALVATTLLATAVATPVQAQSAPSAQQQVQPNNAGAFHGYPLSDWYRTDSW